MGVPGTACCKLLCPGFRLLCFTVVNYRESPARGRYSQLYSVVGSSDAAVRCQHCGSLFGCACARARSTPSRTCYSTSAWTATAGHSFTIDEVPRCRRESLSASRCIGLSAGWLGSRVVSVLDSRSSRARVQIAAATLSGNSLRQTAPTHRASVHQAAKLVAALLRVAKVTAGLAESNGDLPPGL